MEHTSGEYTLQEIKSKVCGLNGIGYICILAPDGERVATVDILDQTDIDHAHKIHALLNAFNGIDTHEAMNIAQVAIHLHDNPGDLKYMKCGAEMVEILGFLFRKGGFDGGTAGHRMLKDILSKLEGGE